MVHKQNKSILANYLVQHPVINDNLMKSIESVHQDRNSIELVKSWNKDTVVGLISIRVKIDMEDYEIHRQRHWIEDYHKTDNELQRTLQAQNPKKLVIHSNLKQDQSFLVLAALGVEDYFDAVYSPASL